MYYHMNEVMQMLDVNASLIRYWCSQFKVLKPKRNAKGNRLFTKSDLDTLKLIYHLVKEKGMTLKGANQVIEEQLRQNRDVSRQMDVLERLQNLRAMLLDIRENLGRDDMVVFEASNDVETFHDDTPENNDAMQQEEQIDEASAKIDVKKIFEPTLFDL